MEGKKTKDLLTFEMKEKGHRSDGPDIFLVRLTWVTTIEMICHIWKCLICTFFLLTMF